MSRSALDNDPKRKARILDGMSPGTLGLDTDVGTAAVFVSSDAAWFVTGVCLPVDGGASIGF